MALAEHRAAEEGKEEVSTRTGYEGPRHPPPTALHALRSCLVRMLRYAVVLGRFTRAPVARPPSHSPTHLPGVSANRVKALRAVMLRRERTPTATAAVAVAGGMPVAMVGGGEREVRLTTPARRWRL